MAGDPRLCCHVEAFIRARPSQFAAAFRFGQREASDKGRVNPADVQHGFSAGLLLSISQRKAACDREPSPSPLRSRTPSEPGARQGAKAARDARHAEG